MDYKLRPFTLADLETLVEYANNLSIARYMTDQFPHPYSRESGEAFIRYASDPEGIHRIFAIEVKGCASGGIGLHPQTDIHRRNAELGYWLAEPYWGCGIISRAVAEMVDYGFDNLEIDRIFARPFGSNLASQRVLEKNGFILEARFEKTLIKNGQYENELVYAIRRPAR